MPPKSTNRNSRKSTKKPLGVVKSSHRSFRKPSSNSRLKSGNKQFWYVSPDGVDRFVTSSGTCQEPPQHIETLIFDPSKFAREYYPSTFPPGARWPSKTAQSLLRAYQLENKLDISPLSSYDSLPSYLFQHSGDEHCVGPAHFDKAACSNSSCKHTFKRWSASMTSWQDHLELRKTTDRGIGVYTKREFEQYDVLGWYAGEIVPEDTDPRRNDYLMTVNIGIVPDLDNPVQSDNEDDNDDDDYVPGRSRASRRRFKKVTRKKRAATDDSNATGSKCVMVDAQRSGNWTRFLNHSCQSLCTFFLCRVGKMRVMVVMAEKHIPAGVELAVNYGEMYYGKDTDKVCHCGAKRCVSRLRKK
jgi:hypothetical protein